MGSSAPYGISGTGNSFGFFAGGGLCEVTAKIASESCRGVVGGGVSGGGGTASGGDRDTGEGTTTGEGVGGGCMGLSEEPDDKKKCTQVHKTIIS